MHSLKETILEAKKNGKAVGHFNISDLAGLKAIFAAAHGANLPVIIGTSEGEREFIGAKEAVALVKSLREEFNFPIFINADHTHSFDKVVEAVAAGYDSVIADFAKLSLEENIKETKKAVDYVRSVRPEMLIEGELGYIGSSSEVFEKLPEGAAINPADLTTSADAARFVRETGVDLLAPAVGNIHGMFEDAPSPRLDIARVGEIAAAVAVPLVLHGGSGIMDEDFRAAISAGIAMVHINTEIRRAWRAGVEEALAADPKGVAPYKLLSPAVRKIQEVVEARIRLFDQA
jgi:fructose-bisphosphate aldolase class II